MGAVIGTVRLWTTARPTDEQFRLHWQRKEVTLPGARTYLSASYNPDKQSGVPLRATYRRESRQGPDQFLIEVSLPRVLYGNNWRPIPDIESATNALDELTAANSALPTLPPTIKMYVSRLDVCYNYAVGELLPYYIEALSRLDSPRRTTVRFNAQTVEYRAKSAKSKFYDKFAECGDPGAQGLLRHEITFQHGTELKQALGIRYPASLQQLTDNHILCDFIERDLSRLGILHKPFATMNTAAAKLIGQLGQNPGSRRYTILSLRQRRSKEQIMLELGIDRNTLNRYLADVRKSGVPLALSEAEEELPPLEVYL
jgi:hypothetical protein